MREKLKAIDAELRSRFAAAYRAAKRFYEAVQTLSELLEAARHEDQ